MDNEKRSKIALVSVKPEYAHKIITGKKKVEFRKVFNDNVEVVVIYSSSPEQRVIGYAKVKKVHRATIRSLWDSFREKSGVTKQKFYQYYQGHRRGVAVIVEKIKELKNPMKLSNVRKGLIPPQSYSFLTSIELKKIEDKAI